VGEEWVVLVDEADREVGLARKAEVHHGATPLHRAFSAFLFDHQGRLLLQQRSAAKATWPLVWSNSCCGHPGPGEPTLPAARRRIAEELGAPPAELWVALPGYRYRAALDGVVENEICPVVVGRIEPDALAPDPAEVAALRWVDWQAFLDELERPESPFSPWCREEAALLAALPRFQAWHGRADPHGDEDGHAAARRDGAGDRD
jgi:isopentenyl-diphosphate delta-isomerase